MNNPLKYSDLIQPDDSIESLREQLANLKQEYSEVIKAAELLKKQLAKVPPSDSDGMNKRATEAERLSMAQKTLSQAIGVTTNEILALNLSSKEQNRIASITKTLNAEQEASYNKLSAQYSLNTIALNKMSQAWRETTAEGRKLVTDTAAIRLEMNKLKEATGDHTLSVGRYQKSWDGLGNSVSQLTRELPALALNANTFFLAISNNIPIMVDEINRLRASNAALQKEGKATVSVVKQVMKSFMSWNTLMMVSVALLTIFGGKLVTWIGQLFKGKEALKSARLAQQNFNEAVREGSKDSQKELTRLKLLYDATQDHSKSVNDRKLAVSELQKLYPEYFKNISGEAVLAGKASSAYKDLAQSIIQTALARAAENQIVKNQEKLLTLREKEARLESKTYNDRVRFAAKDPSGIQVVKAHKVIRALQNVRSEITSIEMANKRLAKTIEVSDIITTKGGKGKTSKQLASEKAKNDLDIQKKYNDAIEGLETDQYKKKKLRLTNEYNEEVAALKSKLQLDKTLTIEQKNIINNTIVALAQKLSNELKAVDDEEVENEKKKQDQLKKEKLKGLKIDEDVLKLQLDLTEKGTDEETDLKIRLLENAMEQEIVRNSQLTTKEQLSEFAIRQYYLNLMRKERKDSNEQIALESLKQQQDYEDSSLALTSKSDYEKNQLRKKHEIEYWEAILKLGSLNGKKLTETQIATIKNTINGLKQEANDMPKDFNIFSLLGLDKEMSPETQDAISNAFNQAIGYVKELMQSFIDQKQAAVDAAKARVEAAQTALDAEKEARANGYAFNLSMAQKELEAARKQQAQAEKQKEKAVKAQRRLDTITQTSSLITATAEIFASMSGVGPWGWALAIAAVAAMWGTFAAAKIKAAQVAKTTYGDGGFEFLEGGSHQSGNDIGIGTTKDGKDRRAEGGETLAILNKKSTRKYRSIIPDIINSINKGVFENKYMTAYDTSGLSVNVVNNVGKSLETDVRAIRKQGEKVISETGGKRLTRYKNLTRIEYV
jgi:hypothetical protein